MSDVDPATAAQMATGDGAQAGAETAGDVAGAIEPATHQPPNAGDSGASLIDGLLETQPAGSIAEYPDMPDAAAHFLIGAQKFIHGISGDRDMAGGKPAVVDFVQGVVSFLTDPDTSDAPDDRPVDDADTSHLVGHTGGEP